jgi:riboflavin synthase
VFTGIVEEVGTVRRRERFEGHDQLEIAATTVLEGLRLGDSINVNGACLTVVARTDGTFSVETVFETLRRTNLGLLEAGDRVNLERALAAESRFGGHIVQGHIEDVGKVVDKEGDGSAIQLTIEVPAGLVPALAPKGFVAVDGVSLTVVDCKANTFTVSIIPFTQSITTLATVSTGQSVNIETDIVARYVERMLASRSISVQGS